MTRRTGIAFVLAALTGLALSLSLSAGPAAARPHIPDADWQNVRATYALLNRIATVAAPDDNFVDGSGGCHQLKRNRWRCPRTVRVTVNWGEAPILCTANARISPHRWRYPAQWSDCPAEWLPQFGLDY
jgi:hypothetical protein